MGIPRITAYSLIGRDDEVRQIGQLLGSLRAGKPAVLVLDGPRGSGRTRLLDETARLARRRDFTVLTGPAWTGGTGAREIPRTGPLLLGRRRSAPDRGARPGRSSSRSPNACRSWSRSPA